MIARLHESAAGMRLSLAVVGSGAAGLAAAHLLARRHDVTIFERADRLGGHAWTVRVPDGPDAGTPLDVGFMVLNDRNYPTLHRLLASLGVDDIRKSEMSFGYCSHDATVQYALNFSAGAFTRLGDHLGEVLRFIRWAARDHLEGRGAGVTLLEYLKGRGFSDWLIESYVVPMGAAIWSTRPARMLEFPAAYFLEFYTNHGLLSLEDGPRWQHVHGGCDRYVDAIRRAFPGCVLTHAAVARVTRDERGVSITTQSGETRRFDGVVLAAHADESLAMLGDASFEERRCLGAWSYQRNAAVLHCDESQMPPDRAVWASWNYRQDDAGGALSVTYHLNRLQEHHATARQYFLTLNGTRPVDESLVLRRFDFDHPTYTAASIAGGRALREANGTRRTYFCGSYLGYGFHEAAIASGAAVAAAFGIDL